MDVKKIFGNNVRYYRKKNGDTQETLSEKLDISQKHLSKIENGVHFGTPELFEKLYNILGVTPSQLLHSEEYDFNELSAKSRNDIKQLIDEALESVKEGIDKL